jgi:hypothetical protein
MSRAVKSIELAEPRFGFPRSHPANRTHHRGHEQILLLSDRNAVPHPTLLVIKSGKITPVNVRPPHTIDRWDDATGEKLVEQIAAVGDYQVALETYRAAMKRWAGAKITLRNQARVIEQSWED